MSAYEVTRLSDGVASVELPGFHLYRHRGGVTIEITLPGGDPDDPLVINVAPSVRGCGDLAALLGDRIESVIHVDDPAGVAVDRPGTVLSIGGDG